MLLAAVGEMCMQSKSLLVRLSLLTCLVVAVKISSLNLGWVLRETRIKPKKRMRRRGWGRGEGNQRGDT